MVIRAALARLAHDLHKFSKANVIFLKKRVLQLILFWPVSPQGI